MQQSRLLVVSASTGSCGKWHYAMQGELISVTVSAFWDWDFGVSDELSDPCTLVKEFTRDEVNLIRELGGSVVGVLVELDLLQS